MMKSLKAGFTLAEVLTTLMVIGVVAAMTIPTLMNSTGEQQARVACKKAASVLAQGVQLLVAREIECNAPVATGKDASNNPIVTGQDADNALAMCMAQVITGTVNTDNATITTPDGMIYRFFTPGQTFSSLETTCGATFAELDGSGNCAVVVDTNGLSRGTKVAGITGATFTESGFSGIPEAGTDVVSFSFSAAGAKPTAINGSTNKAYEYMYGAKPTSFASGLCADESSECAAGPDKGKYTTAIPLEGKTNTCGQGYVKITSEQKVSECRPDNP